MREEEEKKGVIWVLRSSARPQADGTASLKINLTFINTVQSKKFGVEHL